MLYLDQNSINRVSIDAPQMREFETSFYFFYFKHTQTRTIYTSYITRLNPSSKRFGEFNIELPTDLDLTSGTYDYKIYESSNNTETSIDLLRLLESGIAKVAKSFADKIEYEPTELNASVYGNS